jgi:thiamine phosphate synthase YjbQ (UPF0047 family)
MNTTVSDGPQWQHASEGRDDVPADAKSSIAAVSLNIPISKRALNIGT